MRWKAHFFLHSNDNQQSNKTTYGLKSKRTPPQVPEMKHFEDDAAQLIENIKFRSYSDEFIKIIEEDKRKIDIPKCLHPGGQNKKHV